MMISQETFANDIREIYIEILKDKDFYKNNPLDKDRLEKHWRKMASSGGMPIEINFVDDWKTVVNNFMKIPSHNKVYKLQSMLGDVFLHRNVSIYYSKPFINEVFIAKKLFQSLCDITDIPMQVIEARISSLLRFFWATNAFSVFDETKHTEVLYKLCKKYDLTKNLTKDEIQLIEDQIYFQRYVIAVNINVAYAYQDMITLKKIGITKYSIIIDYITDVVIENNVLHSTTGPAAKTLSGEEFYFINGIKVPSKWFEKDGLTPYDAISQKNVELRNLACEMVGWDNIVDYVGAVVINKSPDPQIGELLSCELPAPATWFKPTKIKLLRVKCGTGRTFVLPVPNSMRTAKGANAWTYGFSGVTFVSPEIRT